MLLRGDTVTMGTISKLVGYIDCCWEDSGGLSTRHGIGGFEEHWIWRLRKRDFVMWVCRFERGCAWELNGSCKD